MGKHGPAPNRWQPQYEGKRCVAGYQIEHLSEADGAVVRSKSEEYSRIGIRGCRASLYLDFANIPCGDENTNALRFFDRWGDYYDGFDPRPQQPMAAKKLDEFLEDTRILNKTMQTIAGIYDLGAASDLIVIPDENPNEFQVDVSSGRLLIVTWRTRQFAWLQLADAFTSGLIFGNCEECGAFMALERNTRRYCSARCRKRANRGKPT